ncbi:hypothetical protein HID58_057529 [Brassica napus]|uniref:(rape) hypothetical protein n=1 Tax=Brassica napus TaxID=3708 RepID=A0A816IMX3_BRANA|nr:hypothetical protein HID58_057529 [Brassica napus]CAF1712543.1 unnamed protein product [Brassica napus]
MKRALSKSYGKDFLTGDGVEMRMRVQAALKLEKAIPFSHEMGIIQLKLRDQTRYDRLLQSHGRLLNIPSRELLILSLLVVLFAMAALKPIQLTYFDPRSSVTTTPISCSDQRCSWGVQSSNSGCSAQNNICAYTFQYGGGSCTSGVFFLHRLNSDESKAQAFY